MSSNNNIPKSTTSISRIMEVAGQFAVPTIHNHQSAWKKLDLKKSKQIKFFPNRLMRIAAAVALLCAACLSTVFMAQQEIVTAKGEHRTIELPDHSTVRLNAESMVSFNPILWKLNRQVSFSGEGIFEVIKGSTFTVNTAKNQSVRVLGTSFDVLARKDLFRVACITGKVSVDQGNKQVILTPGLTTQQAGNDLTEPLIFDPKILAWESGEFYFSNQPLSEVISEIERQFNITIDYTASKERYYTGYFNNKDLDEALKLVCLPLGLKYKIENSKKVKIINYEINV
ncbi:DUF4974 domain-containing protein [Fulvivirga sp. RKSG066]|uniref:FecR family protein n=1 Tax=Fulvivirga aurantia TaxID=2529383 RepID=UPI0012BD5B4B|nr:FecR domain-containing protein [Fulvivirga aurantia]MTI22930.1 DUF4974 domain-containing protein [Fulvivirga aurantia]